MTVKRTDQQPKFKVGQVVMDTLNNVPRQIAQCYSHDWPLVENVYFDYSFTDCGEKRPKPTLLENHIRSLTPEEVG